MDIAIAITGEMRTGKDTVKEYLEKAYGMVPFAFGDKLKDEFHETYPHIPRDPKPVRGYQLFGQLQRYVQGNNVWIDKCFTYIEFGQKVAKGYNSTNEQFNFRPVITDMRQPNEFERCRDIGFITVRIEAPLEARLERIKAAGDEFDPSNLNFETETHVREFKVDHIIKNYGSLEDLYKQVDYIMEKHGAKKVN